VNRAETDIEIDSLWGSYWGRVVAAVAETAKTRYQSLNEAVKIKKGGD
jgi:hypothetical protein